MNLLFDSNWSLEGIAIHVFHIFSAKKESTAEVKPATAVNYCSFQVSRMSYMYLLHTGLYCWILVRYLVKGYLESGFCNLYTAYFDCHRGWLMVTHFVFQFLQLRVLYGRFGKWLTSALTKHVRTFLLTLEM